MSLPRSMAIDTGPLILPITRERGWEKIKKLLAFHERGELTLHVGLFNVVELIYVMHRLGYDVRTTMEYASLILDKLGIVRDDRYVLWMGKLRIEAYRHGYNIPWGDISSAATALTLNIPVIVLDEDKHFNRIIAICRKLGKTIRIVRIKDLE